MPRSHLRSRAPHIVRRPCSSFMTTSAAGPPAGPSEEVLPTFIDTSRHCFEVAVLIDAMTREATWNWAVDPEGSRLDHACDWLRLASEIESVRVNPTRFDDSSFYCSTAWNFESKRGDLQAALAAGVVRFSFAWSAFEILVRCLQLARSARQRASAPAAAMAFLERHKVQHRIFEGYAMLVHEAIQSVGRHPDFNRRPLRETLIGKHEATLGLELCRRIRNTIAHGASVLPLPEDWESGDFSDAEYTAFHDQALRLLLISVQMILHGVIGVEHELEDHSLDRRIVVPRLHLATYYDEEDGVQLPLLEPAS